MKLQILWIVSASDFWTAFSDMYLSQLVIEPTRPWQGQSSNILDLILSNQPDMINHVQFLALFLVKVTTW